MKIKPIIALLLFSAAIVTSGFTTSNNSEDIVENLSNAIKDGNSNELAKFFNPSIELEILADENIYSKAQAELLVRDFFSKNKPTSFKINHQGAKGSTSFAIGILVANTGNFRVSIFMKSDNGQMLVHQLRIEKSDDSVRR